MAEITEEQIKDLYWLKCLQMSGVDNWEGMDYAYSLYEMKYPLYDEDL